MDFNVALVYIVSDFLLISSSLTLFSSLVGRVPKATTKIDITATFIFHKLSSPGNLQVFYQFFAFFHFHSRINWYAKIYNITGSFLIIVYYYFTSGEYFSRQL